jgi:hypothetical protein
MPRRWLGTYNLRFDLVVRNLPESLQQVSVEVPWKPLSQKTCMARFTTIFSIKFLGPRHETKPPMWD